MFRRGDMAKPLSARRKRRFEQPRPGQFAVLPVRHVEQAYRARRADRSAADDRLVEGHCLAVGQQEESFVRRHRRRLASVVGHDALAVPVHQEGAAAEARALRLDEAEHELDGDRRVDRGAARPQDFAPRLGRERVGGGGHVARAP